MEWQRSSGLAIVSLIVLVVVAACFTRRTLRWSILGLVVVGAVTSLPDATGWTAWIRVGPAIPAELERVVRAVWSGLSGRDEVPTTVIWVGSLLIVGAVLWVLDAVAARRESPQVMVADPTEADSDTVKELLTELRFRLPAVAVRQPSSVPGTSRGDTVASIVEGSEVQGGKILGGLIRLWAAVMPSPRSYVARLHSERCCDSDPGVVDPLEADPAMWLTVDIRDQRTEKSLAVTTFDATKRSDAAERAAAYVAAKVLRKDRYVPAWSKHGPEHADDLAAYMLCPPVPGAGHTYAAVTANRVQRRERLEPVARHGPVNAIVRYELAMLDELDGEILDALRLHARNRAEFPEFRQGQYRLAMALAMAAGEAVTGEWKSAGDGLRTEVVQWLARAGLCDHRTTPRWNDDFLSFRRFLLDVAEREFLDYRRSLDPWRNGPASAWKRCERSSLWPLPEYWWSLGIRRQAASTAIRLCHARRAGLTDTDVEPDIVWARGEARSLIEWRRPMAEFPWQHAYNLACLLASRGAGREAGPDVEQHDDLEVVVDLLGLVAESPAAQRIVEWIGRDPDLAPLRATTRFRDFVRERIRRDYGPGPADDPPPAEADWFARQVHATDLERAAHRGR